VFLCSVVDHWVLIYLENVLYYQLPVLTMGHFLRWCCLPLHKSGACLNCIQYDIYGLQVNTLTNRDGLPRQPPFSTMIVQRNVRYLLVALQSENLPMARQVAVYRYFTEYILDKISMLWIRISIGSGFNGFVDPHRYRDTDWAKMFDPYPDPQPWLKECKILHCSCKSGNFTRFLNMPPINDLKHCILERFVWKLWLCAICNICSWISPRIRKQNSKCFWP
jgi:hypothetical protein